MTTPTDPLPPNVNVSAHPCLKAKVSQLRSKHTNARETKSLIQEIASILAVEALAGKGGLAVRDGEKDESPLGYEFTTRTVFPASISLVPILRSGLGMVDALQSVLPDSVPVHHLGLFREPTTLQPVEYYNNLPYHQPPSDPSKSNHPPDSTTPSEPKSAASSLAILLDPVIATGGTSSAAIQTLRDWGVSRVLVLSVLGSRDGVTRAAQEWPEGATLWIGEVDESCDARGMIRPGLGDIGDRLFLTVGK
ncbi:MAG: hypothetical protein M1817_005601 [Caeruleum heppii]|nr:MAG: hypothetical protein M1817_005601 [Caeruleum heppii]